MVNDVISCSFCNQDIRENTINPIQIRATLNKECYSHKDRFGIFYAHFDCLKKELHKDITGYFIELGEEDD